MEDGWVKKSDWGSIADNIIEYILDYASYIIFGVVIIIGIIIAFITPSGDGSGRSGRTYTTETYSTDNYYYDDNYDSNYGYDNRYDNSYDSNYGYGNSYDNDYSYNYGNSSDYDRGYSYNDSSDDWLGYDSGWDDSDWKQILMIGGMMTGIQSLIAMIIMMDQQMTIMSTMMTGVGKIN